MDEAAPAKLSCVVIPRFNMMTLTTFLEPLRIANYLSPRRLCDWDFRASAGSRVTASNGLAIDCLPLDAPGCGETVAVFGSWGSEHHEDAVLTRWLRKQARAGMRLIAVELGVYAMARAGVLDGHRATTHWSCLPGFVETFPDIEVSEQLYTIDRKVMTCAGGTAGIDLQLELIARDHGQQLASEVANQLLHAARRPAEAAQRHAAGATDEATHPDVRAAVRLLEANIEEPLSIPDLCRRVNVSQRQLERLFRKHTGCTIAQFGKILRLQYARVLLTSTRMSIRDVSAACGFNSMSYFSQCFVGAFGKKPSAYRQAWPDSDPEPQWPGTVYAFTHRVPPG